jgi:zinc protease
MRFRPTSLVGLAAALLLAGTLSAQQPPAPAAPAKPAVRKAAPSAVIAVPGPSVEGISEYNLPNGLKVLLFPDQSKPTITVNITYLVGSRHEGYGETGMAHLLEHMLFKGSTGHRNIPQELTVHGADPNGTTWYDRTNYFETFAASDSNLVWALDLEADRMVHSFIAADALKSEFTVVRNEFELGENDPEGILDERVLSTAYLWHNYGNSTIGARSDIEGVPVDRLKNFYRRYYQPDNAVLVVAGKIDTKRVLQLVAQKFGRIPRPDRTGVLKIYPTYTRDPVQDGERSVTLRRVGDVQVVMVAYHIPSGADSDFASMDVLAHVLGDAPSGRMYQALVATGKAATVSAYANQFREPGTLEASATVRKEDSLSVARAAMADALAAAVTTPPTEEEVARAKAGMLKRIDLTLNNSEQAALALTKWVSIGDWRLLFLNRDRIRAVTPEDVARAAAAYLKPSNATWGEFVPTQKPDRAEIPPTPDVAALVKDYKGDTARAVGEAFDPSPANIDARTTITTLPGGMKIALLPKQTRGQSVNVRMTLRFGTREALQGKGAAADLAADMLMRGTRTRSRQQIKDELDRLKSTLAISGTATGAQIRMESTRPNLVAALTLLGEILREPAFDAKEFGELQQENLASLEAQRSDPIAQGQVAYERYMTPAPKGDPRYTPTTDEQVADYTAATVEQARQFYAEFYGASNAQLAIVGDFNAKEVGDLAGSLFGAWKSSQPFTRIPYAYDDVPGTEIVIQTPDKANAFLLAGENVAMRDDDPDYPAMVLGDYMLGGGFLSSRLADRIRQKEGASYGVGSFFSARPLDKSGQWGAYAIYAPVNATRVESALREELARALRDGFTQQELAQAKQGWLQNAQVERSHDAALAGELANYLFIDRKLAYDAELERRLAALTPDQVVAVLRRYLDPARVTVVKAGDFKEGAAPAKP